VVIEIQTDTAGSPSGTVVTNGTSNAVVGATLGAAYSNIAFTWASVPVLTAGTKYWFVLKRDGALSETDYYQAQYSTLNPFRAGEAKKLEASWTVNTGANDDLAFAITGIKATAVKCFDTTLNSSRGRLNFLGFATSAKAQGLSIAIQTAGRMTGFSSLTPFKNYFVSGVTAGQIVTTTVTRPSVGYSIETNELIVNVDRLPIVSEVTEKIPLSYIETDSFVTFGGDSGDGILNITAGTTNLAAGTYQYASINISAGAILSTLSTSGYLALLSADFFTVAGNINLNGKITDLVVGPPVPLFDGSFTRNGRKQGNGGGGGGGGAGGGNVGGAGGAGTGGGAGGGGGASGGGTAGAGGASTGGSETQGAGGAAPGGVGGSSAGGGANSGGNQAGGGGGNPGGAGANGGLAGGTGFGANGGAAAGGTSSGGAGAAGRGGNGGMDLIINVRGTFNGTGGTINLSGINGMAGGVGGAAVSVGGGGGGGGGGGSAGNLRIVNKGSFIAPTITLTLGSAGAGGIGGAALVIGFPGAAGPIGVAGTSTVVDLSTADIW
jgi:hypothetical protein